MGGIGHSGGRDSFAKDGVFIVEGAGVASCIVSVLGLLGGSVYACVFGLLVGAVCCVEGGGPGGGVMEGRVWEVPPCCPCVQGGGGGSLRLYGLSLIVSAMGDDDVGGRQLIHLCGVGQVAGDGDLSGVIFAGGGVVDDAVGRRFVVGSVFRRFQFEWGMDRSRRWGLFLGFRVQRYFGLDQVLWAPGFRCPYLGALPLPRPGGGRWCWCLGEEGGWLGGKGVVVLICPPNGVASLGVAVWCLGLGLLDG